MPDHGKTLTDAEQYRQFLEAAPDAMLVVDSAGTIVVANALAERMFGYRREAMLGQPIELLVPERALGRHVARRQAFMAAPQTRAMASGLDLAVRRQDGSEFPAEISLGPLATADGLLVVAAVRDVTEQRRVQRETAANLRIQNAVAGILRQSLERLPLEEFLLRTLDTLLSAPGMDLQAKGAIFLFDEQTGTLALTAHRNVPAELVSRCTSVPLDRCLCGRAGSTREAVFVSSVDERHETSWPGMEDHGHYCVPIVTGDTLYGVIALYVEPGHQRTPVEDRFLAAVADTLAGTIRRRRVETELQQQRAELLAAGMIQRHLLPSKPPVLPGFEIAGGMYPARSAAGDHYDCQVLPDGRLTFAVGDVSGKGVGPAVFMAAVHARLSALVESGLDVSAVLSRANARLSAESDPGTFVTVFLGSLDPRTRTLVYANAGHPAGIVLGQDGQVRSLLDSTAVPLAIFPGASFPAGAPVVLQPGDTVLVLTDGVLEAADPADDFFGSDRTLDAFRAHRHEPAAKILEGLYEAVCAFTHPQRPQDDVTALVIKVL